MLEPEVLSYRIDYFRYSVVFTGNGNYGTQRIMHRRRKKKGIERDDAAWCVVPRATSIARPRKGRPPSFVEALDLNDDRKEASWKKDQVVEVLGTEIQGTSIGAVTVGVCRSKKRLDGRQEGDEQYIFIDEKKPR